MRTLAQARVYARKMTAAFDREVRTRGYRENMCDTYVRKFDKYVGHDYDYPYPDRPVIRELHDDLMEHTT